MSKAWHTFAGDDVLRELTSDQVKGLSATVIGRLRDAHGSNELTHTEGRPWWRLLMTQFSNLLVGILVAAAVMSFVLGDAKDAIAILVIVVLNAVLGFKQEFSAEQAMAALKKLSTPKARVRRDGNVVEVEAADLVPGDILLLDAGVLVPADARLLDAASLRVQESALTGESEGVGKHTDAIDGEEIAVADRKNMVYMGTIVTYGRAEAVVTGTGMDTELGHVATLLGATEDEATPLSRKIAHVGKVLIAIAMGLIVLVAIVGVLRGDSWKTVFMTAVSMAVAAVPEGLPAVVTIALALGAKRMLARNALIRSLPAVETLGAVTAICTDKTGTLTQNVMTVTRVDLPSRCVDLGTNIADPITFADGDSDLALLLGAAALCNDASLNPEDSGVPFLGDPTEGCLVVAANRAGLGKSQLEAELPRCAEAPFDSDRKRMATLHTLPDVSTGTAAPVVSAIRAANPNAVQVVFAKGAVDSLLGVATHIRVDGAVQPLDDVTRRRQLATMEAMAEQGIRVLAIAYRPFDQPMADPAPEFLEQDLVLLGLTGMMDPLREEVKGAVATCIEAGIRPVMITGDHPLMASHIAHELGMAEDGGVLTGIDIEAMSDEALAKAVAHTSVFARVSPEHKLRIVDALQAEGEITSMTGDGVNDAPALKSADIGVAMGITGTDVAKEASDMILLDDSYTTIVSAVREGRVIFDNIRRFIRFILASNTGELLVMLLAPLFRMPLPLLPVQILWMNLVTDGLPALALGVENPEGDVMQRPPRDPDRPIIDWAMARQVLWVGLLMALLALGIGRYMLTESVVAADEIAVAADAGPHGEHEAVVWQTMLFTTMVFAQLFLALAVRSNKRSLFQIGVFSNRPLVLALAATVVLQLAVVYAPPLQAFFTTTALTPGQLGVSAGLATIVFVAVEIEKWIKRLRS